MALTRPWSDGWRPVEGSVRLILLRWLLWIAAGLPGLAAAAQAIGDAGARSPYFADAARPFPAVELGLWVQELPGSIWGAFLAATALAWVGNLFLTAGAVDLLRPGRQAPARVWRTVIDAGVRSLLPFLRVAVLAALWLAIATRLAGTAFDRLGDHAALAGWTGRTTVLALPLAHGILWLFLAAAIGSAALWGKVIVAAQRRRRVRRLHGIVPRLWRRRPLRAFILQVAAGLASLLPGAAVLYAWLQSPHLASPLWPAAWAAVLLAQSWVWHWRLRACLLTWEEASLSDLRATPDRPWGLPRRALAGLLRLARRVRSALARLRPSAAPSR